MYIFKIKIVCWSSPCINGGSCQANGNIYLCNCINNYYGPNCQYTELNSTIFLNSTILTQELGTSLLNLTNISSSSISQLLYRASRHGFGASVFHSKCDIAQGTLTVIKSSNSYIFGGLTLARWNANISNNKNIYDPNSFLFSLTNPYNMPLLLNVIKPIFSIYVSTNSGPTFGNGDLSIADQSYSFPNSYSNLGQAYNLPSILNPVASSFLTGPRNTLVTEIEVYSLNGIYFIFKFNLSPFKQASSIDSNILNIFLNLSSFIKNFYFLNINLEKSLF